MGKKHDKLVEELGQYVREKFDQARYHRAEVTEVLMDCLRQVRGETLSCETLDPDIDVNLNITSPITKGIVGLLRDVFGSSIDKPFVIKPTPVAELDAAGNRAVMDQLQLKLQEMMADPTSGLMSQEQTVQAAIKQGMVLKNAAVKEKQDQADRAAEKMNTVIQDHLVEAGWTKEFGDFLYNFVAYPTAIMKAPSVQAVRQKVWDGSRMTVRNELVRTVENISPFDFYPAPNTRTLDDAEYVIEIRRCTRGDLLGYLASPGFDREGIERVYTEMLDGWKEERDGVAGNPENADPESAIEDSDAQGFYDCVGFYGRIRGDLLKEFGVDVDNEDYNYEAEVWTINDIVIKAVLNPDPVGKRPFFAASFEPIPGAFWGECPVTRLKDIQRVCTATIVALVRNMALSSGVLGEVDIDKVTDDDDPMEIMPNTIRGVKSSNMPQNVYRFYKVPSIANELLGTFERFLQYGYEVIGIPRMAFGSTENIGTLGRTSGGIAMVLNQSSKSIKFAMRVVEENIIEPIVQSFIDHELMFSFDTTIKGDIKVYARGVSGIVEKENQDSKLQWALQSLAPFAQMIDPETKQPVVPPAAIKRMLYNILKSAGVPTEGIFPDYDLQTALKEDGQLNPMVQGATLDGRSQNAIEAISNSNGPMGSGGNPIPGAMT